MHNSQLIRTGTRLSAVVGWGRGMGHKGHMYLASAVISHAEQINADPYFIVSRTFGKNDPFTADEKLEIYCRVFSSNAEIFQAATVLMPDLVSILKTLNYQGYKSVTVVVGADQKTPFEFIVKYNGKPDKSGNILYDFEQISVISRQETLDKFASYIGPRATDLRQVLFDNSKSDQQQYAVWRDAMHGKISNNEVIALMCKAKMRINTFSIKKTNKQVKNESM